ncbi:metallophosphoesterase (plasmid) [Acidiphilium multivorum]|uniref:metallophosphoesterase n=1 Tax=Acidiphilium multivorum TaxID=62140 RepID=UPI001F4BFE9E|nr:metallophosphoesterase [Acidiphilium multivorum]UNC16562.1 metallophosphoesterase [Acidiphilium multivorum]
MSRMAGPTKAAPLGGILFYGDPHGEWRPLVRAVLEYRPAAVVILGDCGLDVPLRQKLASVWDLVPRWRWIIGNHDVDSIAEYEFLVESHPDGDLGGKWAQLDGEIVAGLGGVYAAKVWYPKFGGDHDDQPKFRTRQDMIKQTARADRFKGGVPRSSRATIFPEDHEALRRVRAAILATHDAPTSHRHGFAAIDELAREMGAGLVVHGHHHHSYVGQTADGIPVRGLDIAEPWLWKEGE